MNDVEYIHPLEDWAISHRIVLTIVGIFVVMVGLLLIDLGFPWVGYPVGLTGAVLFIIGFFYLATVHVDGWGAVF